MLQKVIVKIAFGKINKFKLKIETIRNFSASVINSCECKPFSPFSLFTRKYAYFQPWSS